MLVNFAHDSVLVYKKNGEPMFGSPNIVQYDIYPEWISSQYKDLEGIENEYNIKFPYVSDEMLPRELFNLFSRVFNTFNIVYTFDNYHKNLKLNSVDYYLKNDIQFIYPIFYYHPYYIEYRFDTLDLPDNLIEGIKLGLGKIGFFQPTEGTFGETDKSYIWMCDLAKKYDIKKEQFLIVSSNLYSQERYNQLVNDNVIEDRLTIYPYDYFAHSIWFNDAGSFKLDPNSNKRMYENFNNSIVKNQTEMKSKHFLCLNRITRPHRMIIFSELMTNTKLIYKSYVSLGASSMNGGNEKDFYNITNSFIDDNYNRSKERLLNFYKDYNSLEHHVFDASDLENNKADNLNLFAQNNTFLNIVTETLTSKNIIFFSEKIYKPIYCAQPFVLIGNPLSLKKLREKGYKTFGQWWDESYDEELDFTKRFEKIMDVLEDISTWSLEKCFEITQEMEPILKHNFNVMMNNEETFNFYKFITTEKPKKRLI